MRVVALQIVLIVTIMMARSPWIGASAAPLKCFMPCASEYDPLVIAEEQKSEDYDPEEGTPSLWDCQSSGLVRDMGLPFKQTEASEGLTTANAACVYFALEGTKEFSVRGKTNKASTKNAVYKTMYSGIMSLGYAKAMCGDTEKKMVKAEALGYPTTHPTRAAFKGVEAFWIPEGEERDYMFDRFTLTGRCCWCNDADYCEYNACTGWVDDAPEAKVCEVDALVEEGTGGSQDKCTWGQYHEGLSGCNACTKIADELRWFHGCTVVAECDDPPLWGLGYGGLFGVFLAGTIFLAVTYRTGAFLRRKYIDEPDAPFPGGPKFRDAVGWCVCFGETFTLSIFMGKKAYEAARGIQQVAADA